MRTISILVRSAMFCLTYSVGSPSDTSAPSGIVSEGNQHILASEAVASTSIGTYEWRRRPRSVTVGKL